MKTEHNVELKNYSYMRCGGKAKEMIFPETENELLEILKTGKEFFVIGKGSNILFSDLYLEKTLINLKYMNSIKNLSSGRVKVQAGLRLINLINYMKRSNYTGLEKIAGIPGTIGGITVMNGGAYGVEIFDYIEEVRVINENLEIKEIKKENLDFGYRDTEIKKKNWIVLDVSFKFEEGFKLEEVYNILLSRKMKQPLDYPNLGSIFKNPKGSFAAKFIQDLGLKGLKVGGAMISEKHANFIINNNNASSKDIEDLISIVKNKVKKTYNIELEEEIIRLK